MPESTEAGPSRSRHSRDHDEAQGRARKRKKALAMYDPDQDPALKRQLRRSYRDAIEKTEEVKRNIASHKPEHLMEMLKDGDRLFEKVKTPQEGVLDAKNLLNLSELGNQMAKSMKVDHTSFDINDFINKVARYIGGRADTLRETQRADSDDDEEEDDVGAAEIARWDWAKLGRLAGQTSSRAAAMDFMLGPLAIEQKQRKVTHRQPVDNPRGEGVAPQQLRGTDLHQNSKDDLQAMVTEIAKLLQRHGGDEGINVYRFVINPQSFSDSVENFFYVSFLVREGRAGIQENRNGEPILRRMQPPTQEDYERGTKKKQFPLSFSEELYKSLIEEWDIREAVIPTRVARQRAVGSSR